MDIDTNKIDEAVLALLHLTRCDDQFRAAAWKSHDWDALNRLYEQGMINDPVNKAKSVGFTADGLERAKAQFEAMKSEAARIKAIGMHVQMQDQGMVISTHTEMK